MGDPSILLFVAASAAAIIGALGCGFVRETFRAAFCLLLSLAGVAGLFAVAGADVIAALQVIIYVGGVLVLFLFAIMVTPRWDGSIFRRSPLKLGAALAVSSAVGGLLVGLVGWKDWGAGPEQAADVDARAIGEAFLGPQILPFEAVSVLLLAAMVAAVVVIRKELEPAK